MPAALARAQQMGSAHGVVVVTGSIFLVGEVMGALGIVA